MSHHKSHHKAKRASDRNHHLQDRGGWWQFVMEWNGSIIRRACRTTDVNRARQLRDEWMEEIWREGMLRAQVRPAEVVSVGGLLGRFVEGPLESGIEHRKRVVGIVRRMIAPAADTANVEEVLTEATVGRWRAAQLGAIQLVEEKEGQAAAARMKASCNSLLNQAASLFSAEAVQCFKDNGLVVACAEGWRKACRARQFKVASARKRFQLPPAEVVRRIFLGLPDLLERGPVQVPAENSTPPEVQRRNMAAAVALMLGGGLRKGEVSQVRRSMVRRDGAEWRVEGALSVKDGGGEIRQRVMGWVVEKCGVRTVECGMGSGEFLMEGHETERAEAVFRRVSDWMRGLGWEAQKASHGLRDLAISCVIAESGSSYEGQGFARHSSVTVTEQHYGHFAREIWLRELLAEMKQPGA